MATIAECAKHLDLSERRFIELVDAGIFDRQPRGSYELDKVRVSYFRHLRNRALGSSAPSATDFGKAQDEARLAKARADKAEMEVTEMRAELIPADQVREVWAGFVAITRGRLNEIPRLAARPARAAHSIAHAERILREAIDEALADLGKTEIVGTPAKADADY